MSYQEYPKWLYARDGRAVIVADPLAEAELGPGWADSPAAFAAPSGEAGEQPQAPVQEPVPAHGHGEADDAQRQADAEQVPFRPEAQPHEANLQPDAGEQQADGETSQQDAQHAPEQPQRERQAHGAKHATPKQHTKKAGAKK